MAVIICVTPHSLSVGLRQGQQLPVIVGLTLNWVPVRVFNLTTKKKKKKKKQKTKKQKKTKNSPFLKDTLERTWPPDLMVFGVFFVANMVSVLVTNRKEINRFRFSERVQEHPGNGERLSYRNSH